ncbi:hypothetical protein DUNSADRAFT_4096 [Dunaliella salina]|uniref:1-acyl-sn-glycerol-3-phosphate acyltransferase n=1 Tax=Dunaliella salina TaxID=3046 RepID=A0ABQ7GSW6_DUNSA|nr:hypothetical protein DUNSADRAFT_4096 [Dunaliella salina]|eukprot:KAF5837663.1 hypothetical protein DUNSADRAFT_4096 [Dunaliella salina]
MLCSRHLHAASCSQGLQRQQHRGVNNLVEYPSSARLFAPEKQHCSQLLSTSANASSTASTSLGSRLQGSCCQLPHHRQDRCSCRHRPSLVTMATAGIALQGSGGGSDEGGGNADASGRQHHQEHTSAHLNTGAIPGAPSTASSSGSSSSSGASAEEAKPSFLEKLRAISFFCWSLLLSVPLFVTMLTIAPFVMLMDKYKRLAQHFVNEAWAKVSTYLFYPVEVVGRENLPPADKAVVYVANHQSFLDIYSLFHLDRPFKFISKTSNFLIPIIGWSMFLTGHVMINRTDRKSQLECLKACISLLGQGAPVLFFPEGTRSKTRVMAGFKKGAFSVAGKAGVDVVPITLLGTGDLMPSGQEGCLRPGSVRIVVHKPIPTKGRDTGQVCDEARQAIASALPAELVGSPAIMAEGD